MGKKSLSFRSIAARILAWVRGDLPHDLSDDGRSVLPTTGMALLDDQDPDSSLMRLRWSSSFKSGHPVIDQQHSELFDIGNELITAVQGRKPKADIELLLHKLVEHIREHFATEEEVLARTRFPLSAQHMEIHRELLERAQDLKDWYRAGQLAVGDLVGFIAHDVIADHIIKEDLKFALRDR